MEVDSESTLQEYKIQLEQVEIALKSEPDNEELLRLKTDLEEVIKLTEDLIAEEADEAKSKAKININWKPGDKCMAIWRVDGKYYSATVRQIFEDGSCTVVFDGQASIELSQVSQLLLRSKNAHTISNDSLVQKSQSSKVAGNKKAFSKKELETKLREAKKRKREKFAEKLKVMDEISEKEKNKWKNFNTKLASKTWKGVVKKSKFEIPSDHENKIGVGTNSLLNRPTSVSGVVLPTNTNSSAQASANTASTSTKPRYSAQSYRTSTYH